MDIWRDSFLIYTINRIISITDSLSDNVNILNEEIKKRTGFVDYSVVTTVSTSPFTAPSGGVLTWNGPSYQGDGRPQKEIKVNGSVNLDGTSAVASYMSGTVPGKVIPLKKGDIVTFNNILDIKFFSYEED